MDDEVESVGNVYEEGSGQDETWPAGSWHRSWSRHDNEETHWKEKRRFEEYVSKPFSFASKICNFDTEEHIFDDFKEWLLSQNENFLYTMEPEPTMAHVSLGKCPYLHTEPTCEERLAMKKRSDQQERMKKKIEEFLRKRLRLINRLIAVYLKAKRGIENEYHKDVWNKDPYCEMKRRQATKRIVDMMMKQFALEYLYFKCMKIKNEIDEINCIFIETERSKYLKNIYKYTMRTAEKLRCILEIECTDERDKKITFFDDKTLRDMARMYLNELENFTKSVEVLPTETWGSEHLPHEFGAAEGVSEYEVISDILQQNKMIDEDRGLGEEDTTTETPEIDDEGMMRDGNVSITPEKHSEDESKIIGEEDVVASSGPKDILHGEESQNLIQEIKREILKSDYSMEGESSDSKEGKDEDFGMTELSEEMELSKEDDAGEDINAKLQMNKAHIEMIQEFKRELWIMEAFHYYTTQLRPELAGKYKLIHSVSSYDSVLELVEEEDKESTHFNFDSSDSTTDPCLVYLSRYHHSTTERFEDIQRGLYTREKTISNIIQPGHLSEETPSNKTQNKGSRNVLMTFQEPRASFLKWKNTNKLASLPDPANETAKQWHSPAEYNVAKFTLDDNFRNGAFFDKMNVDDDRLQTVISTNDEMDLAEELGVDDIKQTRKKTAKEWVDTTTGSRQGSIPSFSGSLYDPWKKYRKCAEMRQMTSGREESIVYHSIDGFVEEENASASSSSESVKDLIITNVGANLETELVVDSNTSVYEIKLGESVSQRQSSVDASEKSLPTEKSKCFPTLMDIMEFFTGQLKSKSESLKDVTEEEWMGEVEEEEEKLLEELLDTRWKCTRKNHRDQHLQCDFDTSHLMEQLGKSNRQYINQHPEMKAIITLILRQFSLRKPYFGFIKFIKDFVHNKYFAKELSSYLSVHHSGYQRRKGMREGKRTQGDNTCCIFSFDKSSCDYWRDWGVHYGNIVNDKNGSEEGERMDLNAQLQHSHTSKELKDPWDFTDIFSTANQPKMKRDKVKDDLKTGWLNFYKSSKTEEMKSLRKEITCINALTETVTWRSQPDPRSSCQKLHPPVFKFKHKHPKHQ